MKNKALISNTETSICLTLGKNAVTLFKSELGRLIDQYTSKDKFVIMAEDLLEDTLKSEGFDWNYDSRELQRRLAIIFDNIV